MEIDKATKLEKREQKREPIFRGWLRPVFSRSRRERTRLVRGGGNESAAFGQSSTPLFCTPVVNQHPSTRRPPPRQALSGNAQTGLEISNLQPSPAPPPTPPRIAYGYFHIFHISVTPLVNPLLFRLTRPRKCSLPCIRLIFVDYLCFVIFEFDNF